MESEVTILSTRGKKFTVAYCEGDDLNAVKHRLYKKCRIKPERQTWYCLGYHVDCNDVPFKTLLNIAKDVLYTEHPFTVVFPLLVSSRIKGPTDMDIETTNESFIILMDPFRSRLIEPDEWTRVKFNSKHFALLFPESRGAASGKRQFRSELYKVSQTGMDNWLLINNDGSNKSVWHCAKHESEEQLQILDKTDLFEEISCDTSLKDAFTLAILEYRNFLMELAQKFKHLENADDSLALGKEASTTRKQPPIGSSTGAISKRIAKTSGYNEVLTEEQLQIKTAKSSRHLGASTPSTPQVPTKGKHRAKGTNAPEPLIISTTNFNGEVTFSLVESARRRLLSEENANRPTVVAAVTGMYRTGKSYLMSKLMDSEHFFPLATTVQSQTKGIWMWIGKHPKDYNINLILFDTEGLEDIEKRDERHDNIIFALAVCLSDVFVFNSVRYFDDQQLLKLYFILKLAEQLKGDAEGDDGKSYDHSFVPPTFVWTVRDFTLKCEVNGKKLSDDEYLEWMLEEKVNTGASDKIHSVTPNDIRTTLKHFFPQRKCFLFPYPSLDADKINSLEEVSQTELDANFVKKCDSFCEYVWSLTACRLDGGKKMNGSMLVVLIENIIGAINGDKTTAREVQRRCLTLPEVGTELKITGEVDEHYYEGVLLSQENDETQNDQLVWRVKVKRTVEKQENTPNSGAYVQDEAKLVMLIDGAQLDSTKWKKILGKHSIKSQTDLINASNKDILKDIIDSGVFRDACERQKVARLFRAAETELGKQKKSEIRCLRGCGEALGVEDMATHVCFKGGMKKVMKAVVADIREKLKAIEAKKKALESRVEELEKGFDYDTQVIDPSQ